jgi:acyl-CoA synthetase (AMP-forming)/AMP-acid ligase II
LRSVVAGVTRFLVQRPFLDEVAQVVQLRLVRGHFPSLSRRSAIRGGWGPVSLCHMPPPRRPPTLPPPGMSVCWIPVRQCKNGYSVMRGYWDDQGRTREAIDAGGRMHTGDLAAIDERGYCRTVGR